jgi:5-methyltetrahydropteroyltriglutamate--homocysteine methyltransferase
MPITTTAVGSYPKPPREGDTFVLRKTLHAAERGQATEEDIRKAVEALTEEIIREQEDAGVQLPTDGQAGWEDIVTPFARNMAGFEIGGLLRFFDNNVYYRRPVCTGDIEWRGPSSVDAYRYAASVATRPVKAVIPGPVTFARLSIDEHYGDHEQFVLAIAQVLAQEAFELQAAGARFIQIDEPALLSAPEDLDLASRALELVAAELEARTILATYFGDAKRLGAALFELPIDVYGLDFVSGPDNFELVSELPSGKGLQAGIVDARNTKLEPEHDLIEQIRRLADAVGPDNLLVGPSCGLEFLPREKAQAKLSRLSQAAEKAGV